MTMPKFYAVTIDYETNSADVFLWDGATHSNTISKENGAKLMNKMRAKYQGKVHYVPTFDGGSIVKLKAFVALEEEE